MTADPDTFAPPESLTLKVTWKLPPAVGVPPIEPVDEPMDNPGGKPVAENVYGCRPPTPLTLPP